MALGRLGRLLGLPSPAWEQATYWALDLETGGLDPRRDAILAVGMVPIREGTIRLGEAWRTLVRPEAGRSIAPESIRAHQLVPSELQAAPPIAQVLLEIDARLEDAVLLVHYRAVDVAFLRRAFARCGREWSRPTIVDTATLLHRIAARDRRRRPELPEERRALNLSRARLERGLPAHVEHDALSDALATAELFLVLREVLGARTIGELT
ncbi:MAG TPA: 3'-5' exonuclease [Anaeromyxobacteraceae bacterium]|nr:3'-5' exonuclease [Anaeromyxobacteraceae bacterium]